jgi:hypothetical protein
MTSTPTSQSDLLEGKAGRSGMQLAIGSAVCVWNHFLRRWTDGCVFSHVFSADEVMEERRKLQEPGDYGIHLNRRQSRFGE